MDSPKTTILVVFLLSAFLIFSLAIFFFYRMYKSHLEYKMLQDEKINAEINAIKTERLSIANELHNDIAPLLASIRFRLGAIETINNVELEKSNEALSICIEHIKGMVRDLAPIGLYDKSFQQAIKEYIKNPLRTDTLSIDFQELEFIDLNGDKNEFAYRVIQEIIENAIKHSKAGKLIIEVSKAKNNMLIRTADDGIGFDYHEISKTGKKGFGLVSIQNKIDFMNGSISVSSKKNKGTKYNISIPIEE